MNQWPRKCGDVFMETPILTSFGTCFMSNPEYNMTTTTTGVTERMTLLLSTYVEIVRDAAWINDEALKSGIFYSLSSLEHHVNALTVNSGLLSPGTSNLISMKKRRIDRLGFSEDLPGSLHPNQTCRERRDDQDILD